MPSLIPVSALAKATVTPQPRLAHHAAPAGSIAGFRSRQRVFAKLIRHRSARLGGLIVVCAVIGGLLAPLLAPYDPLGVDLLVSFQPPSPAHWFGTDELGRDILSRVLFGSRTSLFIAVVGVLIALALGLAIGPAAGYFGAWTDRILMRLMDVLSSFPSIILAILIIAIAGPGLASTMVAIGISSVPSFARLSRASTLALRNEEFVIAARAIGASDTRLLKTHVAPNILTPLIVQSTLRLSTMVLTAAGLSFIGLGVQPPAPELGNMMSDARNALRSAPYTMLFPGLMLMLIVLGFNLFGDGLRDSLDPRNARATK